MKSKLFAAICIVTLIVILLIFPEKSTPYSGSYYTDTPLVKKLVLKPNNTFIIYIESYKSCTTIDGKYIIKNNHINLIAKDQNLMWFISHPSSGEINGSIIIFNKSENGSAIVFKKS